MKKKQIVGFVGAGMMAFAFTVRADVGVAQKEMNVDGRLDEPCWKTAQWESGFKRFNTQNTEKKKGRTPVAQTADWRGSAPNDTVNRYRYGGFVTLDPAARRLHVWLHVG